MVWSSYQRKYSFLTHLSVLLHHHLYGAGTRRGGGGVEHCACESPPRECRRFVRGLHEKNGVADGSGALVSAARGHAALDGRRLDSVATRALTDCAGSRSASPVSGCRVWLVSGD